MAYVKANAVPRRNSRGGRNAAENLISALRCLYQRAMDDGLIGEKVNPARKVDKPHRLPSTRRAVDDARLAEINHVAATTGDDPELDTLILRCTPRPPAVAAARSRCAPRTWTASSAWSCSGRRARRSAGSRSPRP